MVAGVTVLYDEDCSFCTALAQWLARRGVGIEPIGSATGALFLRDLTREQRYASVHAIDGCGRRASGGAALPVILRELGGGRLAAAVCKRFPGPVDGAYRLIAGNRTRISRWLGTQQPDHEEQSSSSQSPPAAAVDAKSSAYARIAPAGSGRRKDP